MRQRRWKELINEYECTTDYHPGKANVAPDALSRKATSSLAYIQIICLPLMIELRKLGVELSIEYLGVLLASFWVRPIHINRIQEAQFIDPQLMKIRSEVDFMLRANFL